MRSYQFEHAMQMNIRDSSFEIRWDSSFKMGVVQRS